MKKIIIIIAMLASYAMAKAQQTEQLLNNYLQLKDHLVKSDNKSAATAAKSLQALLDAQPAFAEKSAMLKIVKKIAGTTDIEKQRTGLGDLSPLMWKLVKRATTLTKTIYYQYCPMKNLYWLSAEKEIKNPYYGKQMLTCGNVAETKEKTK